MKNNRPLVTVLMTVYNAERYLREAVESIEAQTYKNWELVIVDDGSVDRSREILRKLAKNNRKVRPVYLKRNHGVSYASNAGLAKARGQLLGRMDADDIAMSDRIEKQVKYLLANPQVVAVGGQCELIDANGETVGVKQFPTKPEVIKNALFMYNPLQHPSMMINLEKIGDNKLQYRDESVLAHDLELLLMLLPYGEIANLPETILRYRVHNDSLSLRSPKATFRDTVEVRDRALCMYGYEPSVVARVVDVLQRVVMAILPSEVVYPLFRFVRMNSMEELSQAWTDSNRYVRKQMKARVSSVGAMAAALISR